MTRPLVVLVVVATLSMSPAHAQSHSPALGGLALPLTVRADLTHDGQHSCSQSYATSHATGTLALTIDRAGAAQLTLDGTYAQRMGPSPGRYMQGDHDFTDTQQRHHSVWTGTATIVGRTMSIALDHVDASSLYYAGPTPPALPPATREPTTLGLSCTIASADVFPSIERAGEVATPTRLLACDWTPSAPSPVMFYLSGTMELGAHSGVAVATSETMGSHGPTQQIRFVP